MVSSEDLSPPSESPDPELDRFERAVRGLFPGEPLDLAVRERLDRALVDQWRSAHRELDSESATESTTVETASHKLRAVQKPERSHRRDARSGAWGFQHWTALAACLVGALSVGWFLGRLDGVRDDGDVVSFHPSLQKVWVSRLRDGSPQLGKQLRSGDEVIVHFDVDGPALGHVFALTSDLRVEPMSSGVREVGAETRLMAFEVSGFDVGPMALVLTVFSEFRPSAEILAAAEAAVRERTDPQAGFAANVDRVVESLREGEASDARAVMLEVVGD